MKYTIFCRLGMVYLALSFLLLGCEYPLETVYIEIPVETAEINGAGTEGGCECESVESDLDSGETGADYSCCPEAPESYCSCPEFPVKPENGCNCPEDQPENQPPAIISFTFTLTNPIRTAYSVKDKTVGRFNDPIGGTAPFSYALVAGDGIIDADNGRFMVTGDLLKIQTDRLAAGVYCVHVGVTDSKGMSQAQAFTVTITPDPVVLDQVTLTVQGVNFKMRYVPSGAFMKPGGGMDNVNIEVSIPNGFWMAETETTQELYQLIMGENPSLFRDSPALGEVQNLRPVENVLWYEAVIFCNRLSVIAGREPVYHIWGVSDWEKYLQWAISTGSTSAVENIYCEETANGYRLPNDNEWAWAAMGADTQSLGQVNINGHNKYYSGGPVGSDVGAINFAWFNVYIPGDESKYITHEVGRKLSNELNIFDMTGNVGEWTWERSIKGKDPGQQSFLYGTLKAGPLERLFGSGIRIVSNQ